MFFCYFQILGWIQGHISIFFSTMMFKTVLCKWRLCVFMKYEISKTTAKAEDLQWV